MINKIETIADFHQKRTMLFSEKGSVQMVRIKHWELYSIIDNNVEYLYVKDTKTNQFGNTYDQDAVAMEFMDYLGTTNLVDISNVFKAMKLHTDYHNNKYGCKDVYEKYCGKINKELLYDNRAN